MSLRKVERRGTTGARVGRREDGPGFAQVFHIYSILSSYELTRHNNSKVDTVNPKSAHLDSVSESSFHIMPANREGFLLREIHQC